MMSSYLSLSLVILVSSQISACVFLIPGPVEVGFLVSSQGLSGFVVADKLGFGAAVSGFTPPALLDRLSSKVGVLLIDGGRRGGGGGGGGGAV